MSLQIGGRQAFVDFNQNPGNFKPDVGDMKELSIEANLNAEGIYSGYKTLVLEKLKPSFEKDLEFSKFVEDVGSYKGFEKAFNPFKAFRPNTLQSVAELVVSGVSKFINRGRLNIYKATNKVSLFIYKTRNDERVSTICRPWHNRVLKPDAISGIIPQHKNCRCTIVPYF